VIGGGFFGSFLMFSVENGFGGLGWMGIYYSIYEMDVFSLMEYGMVVECTARYFL
jgi:hypothetical protein